MPDQHKFPRQERLTRRRDFAHVYAHGTKVVGRAFICYAVRQEGQGRKLGISVSRKVGGAVVRNRIRRYIREIYRTHRPRLADDVHLVVIARPASSELTYDQCRDAIRRLFEQGAVFHG